MHSHTRYAKAKWKGGLKKGSGELETESGALKSSIDFKSRLSKKSFSTNPEELLGSALASSFIMQFSEILEKKGTPAKTLEVNSQIILTSGIFGPSITKAKLDVLGTVPNMSMKEFSKLADETKNKCPISKLFSSGSAIEIDTTLQESWS